MKVFQKPVWCDSPYLQAKYRHYPPVCGKTLFLSRLHFLELWEERLCWLAAALLPVVSWFFELFTASVPPTVCHCDACGRSHETFIPNQPTSNDFFSNFDADSLKFLYTFSGLWNSESAENLYSQRRKTDLQRQHPAVASFALNNIVTHRFWSKHHMWSQPTEAVELFTNSFLVHLSLSRTSGKS